MSYYFVIVGTKDQPLFEHEFGTSKSGGDGNSNFREEQRRMNQFIVHAALDIAEEVQWSSGAMYLRQIDHFYNSHISLFCTGARAKFLLLHNPDPTSRASAHLFPLSLDSITAGALTSPSTTVPTGSALPLPRTISPRPPSSSGSSAPTSTSSTLSTARPSLAAAVKRSAHSSIAHNPTSPQAEEAVRQFFADVYENWVKCCLSPFYRLDMPVASAVFRGRVAAAGRKYL